MRAHLPGAIGGIVLLFTALFLGSGVVSSQAPPAQTAGSRGPDEHPALRALRWRGIGPANPGGRVTVVSGIPGKPEVFYVAGAAGGIFKTTNGGDNWSESNSGIASKFTLSVWIDPLDAHNLYAGTSTSGVYRSTDGGATWTQLGGASPASSITSLAVEPGGNVVHAGASGGVWSFQFQPNNPQIALVAPAEGAKIVNGASLLTTISEFILDCATTGSSGSGRGHWRIDVDGALDATGCSASEMRLTKTYANGAHRITVSLRNPDDTELSPAASSSANVTITTAPSRRRSGRK